jgi:hypothetical protein
LLSSNTFDVRGYSEGTTKVGESETALGQWALSQIRSLKHLFALRLHDEDGAGRVPEAVITDTSKQSPAKATAKQPRAIRRHPKMQAKSV